MRILERDAELAGLAEVVDRASGGAGGVALVEGPAGIGKTTLLEQAAANAGEQGMTVALARGGELERDLPWGIVRDLFERMLGAFPAAEREQLLEGAAGLARGVLYGTEQLGSAPAGDALAGALHGLYWLTGGLAERSPLVLVVDDAHWADPSSLRWVAHLARRIEELPAALLLGVRTGEPEAAGPALADAASHAWVTRLRPAPLSEPAARELVEDELGRSDEELVGMCVRLTGGNPFYLSELVRELEPAAGDAAPEDLERVRPESVAGIVRHRLARLPGGAHAVARAVALLGPRAGLATVARLTGVEVEEAAAAADALVAADVLRPGLPLEFAHPLVRRVVYEEIPPAERSLRHASAAALLREAGADAAEVAVHLLAAEPAGDPATVATLAAAARDAAARGAPDAAAAYLRRALEEPAPEDESPQLVWQLGRAEAAISGTGALPTLERALALAPEASTRAEIALDMSLILRISSDFPRAIAILEPVLAELPPETMLSERVEGELVNAALLSGRRGAGTAFERLVRYLDPAAREGVRDARLLASLAAAAVAANQPASAGVELAERALAAVAPDETDPSAALFVAYVLAYCDRFEAARAVAEDFAAQGTARGSATAFGFALAVLSHIGFREGRLREAEADTRRCMEVYRDWAAEPLEPLAFLVDALTERGDLAEAERIVEAVPLESREERWDSVLFRGSRGRLRLARGDARGALDDLLHSGGELTHTGAVNPAVMPWRSGAALAHLALGSRDEAGRLAGEELELARAFGAARALGIALRCAGLAAEARAGIVLLEESVAVLDGSGARLEHARSLCELGAALRRAGRRGVAQEPLREALDLAVRCGAEPLAARARDELRAAGARPRRDAISGRDALTAAELRVAELAASGRTNPQIAQSLFLTKRTVETHLTHAYRKLGIASRSELGQALEQQAAYSQEAVSRFT